MFNRNLQETIEELLKEFRVLYLTGPRQSGKTTLVKKLGKQLNMSYVTLDDQAIYQAVNQDPHGFIDSFKGRNIILDKFQYSSQLVPAIKMCSDNLAIEHKGKFLLTGSADVFRSAKTHEALPGHMARLELYPLSRTEINNKQFNLIDYLIIQDFKNTKQISITRENIAQWIIDGGYPEIQYKKSQRTKTIWFKSYLQGRLFKDFETLYNARGDYQTKLRVLISYLSGLCGNLLKYSNVASDIGLDDKTSKTYISLLELMFIVKTMPAFRKNRAKREITHMPKLHFVDTGLACYLLGLNKCEQLIKSNNYGGLLENFIMMEITKHSQWALNDISVYHFRDKRKNEVDIILEQTNGQTIAIEVKASASVSIRDFKGILKFADFVGSQFSHGIVFYSGKHVLPFNQGKLKLTALPIGLLNEC